MQRDSKEVLRQLTLVEEDKDYVHIRWRREMMQ